MKKVLFLIFVTSSIAILFFVLHIMKFLYAPFNIMLFRSYMIINFIIYYLGFKQNLFSVVANLIMLFTLSIIAMGYDCIKTSGNIDFLMVELNWLFGFFISNFIFLFVVVSLIICIVKYRNKKYFSDL